MSENAHPNLWRALTVSIVLHGAILAGTGCIWQSGGLACRPAFQSGDSALALTLLTSPVPEKQMIDETPEKQAEPKMTADVPAPEPVADEFEDENLPEQISETVASPPPVQPRNEAAASAKIQADENQADQPSAAPANSDADPMPKGAMGGLVAATGIYPRYPLSARQRGEEGVVLLKIVVNRFGQAQATEIVRSSGFSALDEAARDAVRKARFTAADGRPAPVEAQTLLSFRFRLVD